MTQSRRKTFFSARLLLTMFVALNLMAYSQNGQAEGLFRVGERLTYTVSLEKFPNVAYAEMYVASSGKIGTTDVVEIRTRARTLDFASAAFYSLDRSRTVFASPISGLPLYIRHADLSTGLPKESFADFSLTPTPNFDLATLIYAVRRGPGNGSIMLQEGDRTYAVSYQQTGVETLTTDAGTFETSLITVQSEYFTEIGLRDLRINVSSDDARIPVLFRSKTEKGQLRMTIASISNDAPVVQATATPVPAATPRPVATPKPSPTPRPYVPNMPLATDLAFVLGETLEFKISTNGMEVGTLVLRAEERNQFEGADSLLITARLANLIGANPAFGNGGEAFARVDPETLASQRIDVKFSGGLASANHTAVFDQGTSTVNFGSATRIEVPVGTHSLLSLVYALRSFNLKPSRDLSNPVNDTRVAVFWIDRTSIFTLRPSLVEVITLAGEKISGQQISVTTGIQSIDQLSPKIWLGTDERRLPLRMTIGTYQLDLVSSKVSPPQ